MLREIHDERHRQDAKWGQQNHPSGTGPATVVDMHVTYAKEAAREAKWLCDARTGSGRVTWFDILNEEFYEYSECADPQREREELIQLAACCVARVEHIDRST